MSSTDDAAVLCLGDTEHGSFPVVLIFGREYNGEGDICPGLGHYNFRQSPKSAFWNRSYRFIERAAEMTESLKQRCICKNRSPVVFTNASPCCIPNHARTSEKRARRKGVSPFDIANHVGAVFDLPIAARVRLVILSVGDLEEFEGARESVRRMCHSLRLPLMDLPYFANPRLTNARLGAQLKLQSMEGRHAICEVVSLFLAD